jgi:ribose transport system substrate-binding protein
MRIGRLHRGIWCVVAALTAIVVAGCGSSSNSSTSSSGSSTSASSASSSNPQLAEAKKAADAGQQPPTSIVIDKPLSKKPPTGKTIIFLRCSQPVCQGFQQGLAPAAKALGWKMKFQPFAPTPEGIQSAMNAAIKAHPDGIFETGIDIAILKTVLPAAQKAGIPIVSGYEPTAPAPPIIANIADGPRNELAPKLAADWIAADSAGKAHVAVFNIKLYPILNLTTNAFKAELTRVCPDCSVKEIDQQVTDVGTKIPANAVSNLQRDPKLNYLAFAFGDMSNGVPAALKGAGLQGKAKIIGYGAGSPANVANVAKGDEAAETAYSIPYGGWRALDAFARKFVGDDPSIDTTAVNPGMIFTKANAKGGTSWDYSVAPDYQAEFKKLWHVG